MNRTNRRVVLTEAEQDLMYETSNLMTEGRLFCLLQEGLSPDQAVVDRLRAIAWGALLDFLAKTSLAEAIAELRAQGREDLASISVEDLREAQKDWLAKLCKYSGSYAPELAAEILAQLSAFQKGETK